MESNNTTNNASLTSNKMYIQKKLNCNLLNKSKKNFRSKLIKSSSQKQLHKNASLLIDIHKSRNINNFNRMNYSKNLGCNSTHFHRNFNKNMKLLKPSKSILFSSSTKKLTSSNNSIIFGNFPNNNSRNSFNQDLNLSSILGNNIGESFHKNDINPKLNKNYHCISNSFNKNKNKVKSNIMKLNKNFLLKRDTDFFKTNTIRKNDINSNIIMNNSKSKIGINNENEIELIKNSSKKIIEKATKKIIPVYNYIKKGTIKYKIYSYSNLENLHFNQTSKQLRLKNKNTNLISYKEFIYELKNNTDYLERMRKYNNKIRFRKKKILEKGKKFSFYKYKDYMESIEKENISNYQKEEIKKHKYLVSEIFNNSKVKNNTKPQKETNNKIQNSNDKENNSNDKENNSNNEENNSNNKNVDINNNNIEVLDEEENNSLKTDEIKVININNRRYSHIEDKNYLNGKNSKISKTSYQNIISNLALYDKIEEEIYVESVSAYNSYRQLLSSVTEDNYNNKSTRTPKRKSIDKIINNIKLAIKRKKENHHYKIYLRFRKEKPDINTIISKKKLIEKIKNQESKNAIRRQSIKNYLKSPFLYIGKNNAEYNIDNNNVILSEFIKKNQENQNLDSKIMEKSKIIGNNEFESENISDIMSKSDIIINEIIENMNITEDKNCSKEISLDIKDNFMIQYFKRYYPEKDRVNTKIKIDEKIKEVYIKFLNLIQNNTKMMQKTSPRDNELFIEFREKMDSLKKVNREVYKKFIFENYKYFKKELDDCKKGTFQKKCINDFLDNMNNDLDNRKKIDSKQNIKAVFS